MLMMGGDAGGREGPQSWGELGRAGDPCTATPSFLTRTPAPHSCSELGLPRAPAQAPGRCSVYTLPLQPQAAPQLHHCPSVPRLSKGRPSLSPRVPIYLDITQCLKLSKSQTNTVHRIQIWLALCFRKYENQPLLPSSTGASAFSATSVSLSSAAETNIPPPQSQRLVTTNIRFSPTLRQRLCSAAVVLFWALSESPAWAAEKLVKHPFL